ncbi:hypothetical protein [Propionibacterium freudenreichii]|uniref:hypothetical protein n=1 Tax=Propionibacterium freudenreichii TaxID=1744 RepID=UPI0025507DEA|nr:hypothetical protein [Propionibacterium freudenreichii]MDK9668002.1 hypothetical protein [Propionibacterium freudenreichii]
MTFTHSAGRHGVSEQDAIWAIEHNQLGAGLNGYTSPDDKRIVIGLFPDGGVGVV